MEAVGQTEFIGMLVLAVITLVSFITPILKLNSSIVKLNLLLEELTADQAATTIKVDAHENKIHDIELKQENHEGRLKTLERQQQTQHSNVV